MLCSFYRNLKKYKKGQAIKQTHNPSPRSDNCKYFVTCFESFFNKRKFTSSEFVPIVAPPHCPLHDLPLGLPRSAFIFMCVHEQASTLLRVFSVFISRIVVCVVLQLLFWFDIVICLYLP